MALAQIHIYEPEEFKEYLFNNRFSREIRTIQNHHTWLPAYGNLTPERGEAFWVESMRNVHINDRKWSDIGQNITTFPSGKIALCRPIEVSPAGIFGANTGAICIEHFGNFDRDKDAMTGAHRETIIFLNALLCKKFGLKPSKSQVVYHHWYDRSGKRFAEEKVNNHKVGDEQKTCPGTDFFGGNTIIDAETHFFPLIENAIAALQNNTAANTVKKNVNTEILNVRSGAGTTFGILKKLKRGTEVTIYAVQNEWSKISNTADEWVFSNLLS